VVLLLRRRRFTALAGVRDAALLVSADPLFMGRRETLVAVANRHVIPAIYGRRDFAAAGGLVSYGANLTEPYRLMGTYAGRYNCLPLRRRAREPSPGSELAPWERVLSE
jgi:ABC-type uncharacterized transport system substrate-binding protein